MPSWSPGNVPGAARVPSSAGRWTRTGAGLNATLHEAAGGSTSCPLGRESSRGSSDCSCSPSHPGSWILPHLTGETGTEMPGPKGSGWSRLGQALIGAWCLVPPEKPERRCLWEGQAVVSIQEECGVREWACSWTGCPQTGSFVGAAGGHPADASGVTRAPEALGQGAMAHSEYRAEAGRLCLAHGHITGREGGMADGAHQTSGRRADSPAEGAWCWWEGGSAAALGGLRLAHKSLRA